MDWFVVSSAFALASMYGLLGVSISLTWSSIGMLNLAQGFIFAFAGYGSYVVAKDLVDKPGKITFLQAALVGLGGIVAGAVAGLVVGAIAFLPLHDRPNFPVRSLIATLAISLAGAQILQLHFGPLQKPLPKVFTPIARALDKPKIEIGSFTITWDRLGAIVASLILVTAVLVWMRTSRRG